MATTILKRQCITDTTGNPVGVILPLEEFALVKDILEQRFPTTTESKKLDQMKQAAQDPLFMADLHETMSVFDKAFVPSTALAQSIEFDDDMLHVSLTDGRIVSAPLIWFPLLHKATPEQRQEYEIGGGDVSLHWPAIDEDLSVANLLAGADWQSA